MSTSVVLNRSFAHCDSMATVEVSPITFNNHNTPTNDHILQALITKYYKNKL